MLSTKMQIGKLMSEIRKTIFKLDAPRFWWNSVQYSLVVHSCPAEGCALV